MASSRRALDASEEPSRRVSRRVLPADEVDVYRGRIVAFLASVPDAVDDLEIAFSMPPGQGSLDHRGLSPRLGSVTPRCCYAAAIAAQPLDLMPRLLAAILAHYVDDRLPGVRLVFVDAPASDRPCFRVRRGGVLLFDFSARPAMWRLLESGFDFAAEIFAFHEGCRRWPDRRCGAALARPGALALPRYGSLASVLPRYGFRVRTALSGCEIFRMEFSSRASVADLLAVADAEALRWVASRLPADDVACVPRFEFVLPPFVQRDSTSLDAMFPRRRVSSHGTAPVARHLSLFRLGVASPVGSQWLAELQLVVAMPYTPRFGVWSCT